MALINVALAKTCSESSDGGGAAENAVDNDTGTYAHTSAAAGEWWKIDLGAVYEFNQIDVIKRTSWGSRPYSFYIQTADDYGFTENVVNIVTVTDDYDESLYFTTADFGAVSAQFVRIICHTASQYINLAELRVWVDDAQGLLRSSLVQSYDLSAILARNILAQPYSMLSTQRAILSQVYGIKMLAVFNQLYGDMPVRRAVLEQFYGDNTFLRRMLTQEYGDAARYRAVLDQEWASFEGMRAILTQRYTIADHQVRAMVEANYDLSERDQVRALMDQLYVLAAGEALVQASDISVTAVNGSESRAITSAYNINIEQDEALYYMVGELQLAGQAEYEFLNHLETVVTIVIDGFSSEFIPLDPSRQRGGEGTVYIVPLVSKSVLLDHAESDYSLTEDTDLSGMAQTIVTDLAAAVASVDWQMVDWFIPPKKLYTNNDTAMTVIKRIVNAAGGVVQTSPDGVLICRPEYPVSVDKWDAAVPDIELTDQDDFFSIFPQEDPRDGFNWFFISDEQLGSDGLRIEEVQISARKKEVRVFMVPWDDSASITLHHSGGSWVTIIADGVRTSEKTEQVEFVAGAGRLSKPVYGSVAARWTERDLGEVAATEEGNLVADLEQNSLADITYTTRFFKFIVTDDKIEDVQVYPEMIDG